MTDKHLKSSYDPILFNDTLEILVSILSGIKIDSSNWNILLIKTINIVSGIKDLSNEHKIQLICDLVVYYISNYNNILSSEYNIYIKNNIETLVSFMFNNVNKNKKQHKKNIRRQINQTQLNNKTNDKLVNSIQLMDTLKNKLTKLIIKDDININNVISELPSIISDLIIFLDDYNNFTKREKEELVIQSLKKVLYEIFNNYSLTDTEEIMLIVSINNINILVSTLFDVVNGEIDFGKKISLVVRLVNKYLCCRK